MGEVTKLNKVTIREASPYDASKIARLIAQWGDTTPVEFPTFIEKDVMRWTLELINSGKVWVAEHAVHPGRKGRMIGVMAIGYQIMAWNTQVPILKDHFMFVSKTMQKQGVGDALLSKALAYAAAEEVPFFGGIASGIDIEGAERFFKDHGGTPIGGGVYAFGLHEDKQEVS